jgi:hypothetical protein
MDLNGHWYPAVVRDASTGSTDCPFGLRSPILVRASRILSLVVERGQVLSVLDNDRRFMVSAVTMASLLLRVDLVALLVLNVVLLRLLLLLLHLLLLLELLLTLGVHLLLHSHVVLGGGSLLLCLSQDQGGVHSSRAVDVLATADVAEHAASSTSATTMGLSSHVVRRRRDYVLSSSVVVRVCVLAIA